MEKLEVGFFESETTQFLFETFLTYFFNQNQCEQLFVWLNSNLKMYRNGMRLPVVNGISICKDNLEGLVQFSNFTHVYGGEFESIYNVTYIDKLGNINSFQNVESNINIHISKEERFNNWLKDNLSKQLSVNSEEVIVLSKRLDGKLHITKTKTIE